MITRDAFLSLPPFDRRYIVYMAGARDDEPNVPDEPNPYESGSNAALEWNRGAQEAALHAQDSDDG